MALVAKFTPSSIQKINDMQGGWPIGTIQGLIGRSESGKSIFTIQESIFSQKDTDKNILLVLLEGRDGFFQVEPWVEVLNKRFNTDFEVENWTIDEVTYLNSCIQYTEKTGQPKIKKGKNVLKFHYKIPFVKQDKGNKRKVIALQLKSLLSLFLMVGMPAPVENSESGKQTIKPRPEWEMMFFLLTPLGKMMKENNIGFLALDSISTPLKNIFVGGIETFDARSKAEAMILSRIDYLSQAFDTPLFVINHISESPIGTTKTKAYGGGMIGYTHKFALKLMGEKNKFFTNSRTPIVKPYSVEIPYKIANRGIFGL